MSDDLHEKYYNTQKRKRNNYWLDISPYYIFITFADTTTTRWFIGPVYMEVGDLRRLSI